MRTTTQFGMRNWECGIAVILWCVVAASAYAAQQSYAQLTKELSQAIETCRGLSSQGAGYDAVFRRDPMRALVDAQGRLVTSAGLHGGLSVEGIIWSSDRPLAVIDDELFAKGDVIGPYTIVQVRQNGIVVQRGKEFRLIPLDRGIETQVERQVDPLSLLSLPEDVPVPLAPRRSQAIISE